MDLQHLTVLKVARMIADWFRLKRIIAFDYQLREHLEINALLVF